MEERNGNNFDNSAALVKLKKRQLNGSPFDLRSGKSYMEKFLQTPSPDHKIIYEMTVDPPMVKLPLDSSSESGTETVEIGTVSPAKRSSEIKENVCSSPNYPEPLKPIKEDLNSKFSTLGNAKATVPVLSSAVDTTRTSSITATVAAENGILIDDEQNHKSGLYVGTPDKMTGEIENHTDASATTGMDTDSVNEHSFNSDPSVFSSGKCGSASDGNKGHLDIQGLSSDSQLFVVPTVSDGKHSTSMKYKLSGLSFSAAVCSTANNIHLSPQIQLKHFLGQGKLQVRMRSHPFKSLQLWIFKVLVLLGLRLQMPSLILKMDLILYA